MRTKLVSSYFGQYFNTNGFESDCKLVFLPPYSPDYNPIELGFSMIKSHLRRHNDDCTLATLDDACLSVDPMAAWGFFRTSGYI